jgi:hypothetical protein
MWIHLLTARAFVRNRAWQLAASVLAVAIVGLLSVTAALVLGEVDRDIRRTAESIVLDVVVRDSADQQRLDELRRSVLRRPEVHRARVMMPEEVWSQFQSEIGVQSEGLADIAAMPQLLRVRLTAGSMSRRQIVVLVSRLQSSFDDVVENVIVPYDAITDVERRRQDFTVAAWSLFGLLACACLLTGLVTGRMMRLPGVAERAAVLGRTQLWLRGGQLLTMVAADAVGGLVCIGCVFMLAPWLHTNFVWIDPHHVPAASAAAIGASTGLFVLLRIVHSLWPQSRQRG